MAHKTSLAPSLFTEVPVPRWKVSGFVFVSYGMAFVCFYDCSIVLWNQSDRVVVFVFHFILYISMFHIFFLFLMKNSCITFVFQIVLYLINRTTMIDITETAPMATPIVVPTESNKINIIQKDQCNSVTMTCN